MHSIRRINDFRSCGAFDADAAIGMIRIGLYSGNFTVFDRRDHAAARRAHGAVGLKVFGGDFKNPRSVCQPQQSVSFRTQRRRIFPERSLTFVRDDNTVREQNRGAPVPHRKSLRIISLTSTSLWLRSTSVISNLCCLRILPYLESTSSRIGTRPY